MTRYFKRKWAETRGDEFDFWGTSTWYFEVGSDGYPIKQIELYENGNRLKYHSEKTSDDYGGLGDQPLDMDEFQNFEIEKEEFDKEWNKSNPKKEHQEIKISRSNLITKCDQYLNGELEKSDLENYASDLIEKDFFDWDDEIISDIIFQWDSPEINFPINKKNIELWKHQLETEENLLADYNLWNKQHIDRQKEICEKYRSKWNPINKKLYPDEKTPVLKHYSEFDSVYVGLLPFFKFDKEQCDTNSSKKVISIEEAREKDEISKKIGNHSNVTVYSSNECYPTNEEISQNGKKITWKEIIQNTKLYDNKELNKALMTSIGAFKKDLQREDLLEILNQYSDKNNIWHPTEGAFDFFTKSSIFEILKSKGISKVDVEDEFYENKKNIVLNDLTQNDFCEKIDFKDYYIYDNNKSILFAISWDYFFFFIAINKRVFSKESIETKFEGFWADKKSSHLWTWEKDEIDRLLDSENELNKKTKN